MVKGKPSPEADPDRPTGPLRHRCADLECDIKTDGLLKCAGCKVMRYCCREHQALDRDWHKVLCKKIKKARETFAARDAQLRRDEPGIFDPGSALEGHMWDFARGYMMARFELAELVKTSGTLDGVQEALDHMLDMVRLGGGNIMIGVHDIIPPLLMRLDRDEECYDFIRWWEMGGRSSQEGWDTRKPRPALDLLTTTLTVCFEGRASTISIATMLLLKLKFLVDIRNLKVVRQILPRTSVSLPVELHRPIELAAIRSPVCKHLVRQSNDRIRRIEKLLINHIQHLFRALFNANDSVIHALFLPTMMVRGDNPFTDCSEEKYEEVLRLIHFSYAAWWETEDVLELLNVARECASASAEAAGEVEALMASEEFKTGGGKNRDYKAVRQDLGTNRISPFLYLAVQDYAYLGHPDNRPSQKMLNEQDDDSAHAFSGPGSVRSWGSDSGAEEGNDADENGNDSDNISLD